MVIERSAAGEVARLVAQLRSDRDVARESAVARLTILGTRAVDHLIDALDAGSRPAVRVAVLRVLDAIGDRRALGPAIAWLNPGTPDLPASLAAMAVVRGHLRSTRAADADRAFEALTAVALDRSAHERLRLAAIDALADLPSRTRQAISGVLSRDSSPRIRARAAGESSGDARLSRAALDEAADGRLPESPDQLRALVAAHATSAPLTTLHRLVGEIRARETEESGAANAAWLAARGDVHQALGMRQSTVALYDLRETVASARAPLPAGFLAALSAVGDASCLAPVAQACFASSAPEHDWWRDHLASVFGEIARRARITRTHAAFTRLLARWPEAGRLLAAPRGASTPSRSTPRRRRASRT